ncbi:MFS family permease [Geodermatophilus bullaregiensis]|uniref:MFS transporter n=1 Tax=Geodermatophilus bullaregiensis TaxID=1564160 RepID=UPI0019578D4C|nr:MFS transporter [Geodermatophilus bullaregiensis]MBM7807924.1 MFS family permease [Geodermatophilus bullaregiensis]
MLQLLAVMALIQAGIAVARPVTTYRAIDLGAGALAVGLLTGAFALLPMLVALPLGRLADRRRPEPILVGGLALLVAGCVLLAVSDSLSGIAAGNVVLGLGNLGCIVGGENVVARLPPAQLDGGFGLFTAVVSGGQLVGPALAGFVLSTAPGDLSSGTSRALLVSAGLCALGLPAAVWLAIRRRFPAPQGRPGEQSLPASRILRLPGVPSGVFTSLVLAAAVDLLTAYLPLLGESRGIAPSTVGVLLSVRAGATVASRVLVPRMLRWLGRPRLVVLSTVGSGLAVACLPAAGNVAVLAVLLAGIGFLLGVGQPLMMTVIVRAVPEDARGAALALRLVGNRIGLVGTPAAAGLLAGTTGLSAAFWLLGALLGVAIVGARHDVEEDDDVTPPPGRATGAGDTAAGRGPVTGAGGERSR